MISGDDGVLCGVTCQEAVFNIGVPCSSKLKDRCPKSGRDAPEGKRANRIYWLEERETVDVWCPEECEDFRNRTGNFICITKVDKNLALEQT